MSEDAREGSTLAEGRSEAAGNGALWWRADKEQADRQAAWVRELLRLKEGQRVLEVGCGPGSLAFALARAGLEVTCLDPSSAVLEGAEAAAREAGLDDRVRLVRGTLGGVSFEGEFDGALAMRDCLGVLEDELQLVVALQSLARALKEKARLIIECTNPSFVRERLRANDGVLSSEAWDEEASRRIRRRVGLEDGGRRLVVHTVLEAPEGTKETEMSLRLIEPGEMVRLLQAAGLEVLRILGGLPEVEYTRGAPKMVMVCRRR